MVNSCRFYICSKQNDTIMNNFLLKITVLIAAFITSFASAQEFQGQAVYQSKTKIEMDLAGSGLPADRIKMIQERMKSQLENTYVLNFNKKESTYKKEEKLDQSTGRGGGMRMMMMGINGSGVFYKNTQEKKTARETEFSGKNFLIKDAIKEYDWKMEEETKMIGQNLCFKATTVIEMPAQRTSFRMGRRNASEEKEKESEPQMESVIVTAWYTLDIPVNHGPGDYWGLPGLILEINSGNTVILCTKIVMNPKEKAKISEPTKGKEVTQEKYDKIIQGKMKEMRERMGNERQKGGGQRTHIRIGG